MDTKKLVEHYNNFIITFLSLVITNNELDMDAFKESAIELIKLCKDELPKHKSRKDLGKYRSDYLANIQMDLYLKAMCIYLRNANNNEFQLNRSKSEVERALLKLFNDTTGLTDLELMGVTDATELAYFDFMNNNQNVDGACAFLLTFRKERFKLSEKQYRQNSSGSS